MVGGRQTDGALTEDLIMKTRIIAPLCAILLATGLTAAHAANVPCEEALKELRAKETSAPVPAANKTAYEDLKAKGIERCNADDDKRADDFFKQAMDLQGK
jgi:hypothetical protein